MAQKFRRLFSLLLALVMVITLAPPRGKAILQGVYFTAANEQLMELNSATMPFWSGSTLYVSSKIFDGTDLGINYARNSKLGLAMLYTSRTDLRFDLNNRTAYDKQGNSYTGYAIERGGMVFFPLNLVCVFFGLSWSYASTDTAPLIRVRNNSAILDDKAFIDAASDLMENRYTAYEKWVEANTPPPVTPPATPPTTTPATPPIHAAEDQKVHLIIDSQSAEDTLFVMHLLGKTQATFLLSAEQLENGDLVRALTASGHEIALRSEAQTAAELEAEIADGRQKLWQASCSWLRLVWYNGNADLTQLLDDAGCQSVTAMLDRSSTGLGNAAQSKTLFNAIGQYRQDVTVFLGSDSGCKNGLSFLVSDLLEAQYHICAWRLNT